MPLQPRPPHYANVHSYALARQPAVRHIEWRAKVNFDTRTLDCVETIHFNSSGTARLDMQNQKVLQVTDQAGKPLHHRMLPACHPVLGRRFMVDVPEDRVVIVTYQTDPGATGMQWLTPKQAGSKYPFAYTQCQAIHARSILICPDYPSARFTFNATLTVPKELRGLVAANQHVSRMNTDDGFAIEMWRMTKPIPSYLFAFAVGDLSYRELSKRCRVWALPHMIDRAAAEFAEVPQIMLDAEELFGIGYQWDRYDILVLPPAFPYGGMENPCLTFVTPALIVGDKSMIHVIIHEHVHSYFGNLVTNAGWGCFALNEGSTVYGEHRLMEKRDGIDVANLYMTLRLREFKRDLERLMTSHPEWTKLDVNLEDVDPDDSFSRVPYVKGAMFWVALERVVGRERFDAMIRAYIQQFHFKSVTSEEFLDFARKSFSHREVAEAQAEQWVYHVGLPDNVPAFPSKFVTEVMGYVDRGAAPSIMMGQQWNERPAQWLVYLGSLHGKVSAEFVEKLDGEWNLTSAANPAVRQEALLLSLSTGSTAAYPALADFLAKYGRTAWLKPLYQELVKTEDGRTLAEEVFKETESGLHPITAGQIRKILGEPVAEAA